MLPTPHTLTLFPSVETLDADGSPVLRPSLEGVPARGFIQPRTSTEDVTAGQQATGRAVVFLAPSAPFLDAFSELEFAGRRWQLHGAATPHTDTGNVRLYWRAELRQVT